jgi:hypothetical protein
VPAAFLPPMSMRVLPLSVQKLLTSGVVDSVARLVQSVSPDVLASIALALHLPVIAGTTTNAV